MTPAPLDLKSTTYHLKGLSSVNVLLGKNGCGKSMLLRQLDQEPLQDVGAKRYISPERAGKLLYEANVALNMQNAPGWLEGARRRNQADNFKEQSVARFSQLETAVLRRIEKEKRADTGYTFDRYVDTVNELLDRIEIKRRASGQLGFEVYAKGSDQKRDPTELSSGEAQLISLAIEFLTFETEITAGRANFLLIDEPDVHLHPDLQVRLVKLLIDAAKNPDYRILLATHSTSMLAALSDHPDARVCFMRSGQTELTFTPITNESRRLLPVFGAHPLSNVFNEKPLLLVEGDDEERIWQQAVRSSNGALRLHPVGCGGVGNMPDHERAADVIIQAVYDDGVGYSLRDRDDGDGSIGDQGSIRRFQLVCRASENLMLTDEVLSAVGESWDRVKVAASEWTTQHPKHPKHDAMMNFVDGGSDRLRSDLKEVRNIFLVLIHTNKPWEVLVGQAIAKLKKSDIHRAESEGSLYHALGRRFLEAIMRW